MNFEKKLEKLEDLVEEMESGDFNLNKALKNFEQGVKLSRECHAELDQAEQKVKLLMSVDKDGKAQTKDFKDA